MTAATLTARPARPAVDWRRTAWDPAWIPPKPPPTPPPPPPPPMGAHAIANNRTEENR